MSERVTAAATKSEYAILGCGSVGYAVAQELDEKGNEVIIFDRDERRVEALRDQDLNAVRSDITEPDIPDQVADVPVVLILTSYVDDNKEALRNLKESNPDQYVIVRASDPVSQEELEEEGADFVINPPQVIAESALRALETGELEHRVASLIEILESGDNAAVVVHSSLDPDPIASAAAVRVICDEMGIESEIVHDDRHEQDRNQAFINLLDIDLLSGFDLDEYDTVVLVENADTFGGVEFDVDVYINHDESETEMEASFVDVRTNVGSTSTILTKYLQELEIDTSTEIMTGLLHGIRTETEYFRRDTSPADLTAAAYLHPFADHDLLDELESRLMTAEEFDVLAESIRNREVYGSNLVSNVGFINSTEVLTRSAENLLDLEGVNTTVVFGVTDETVYISAKSDDVRVNIVDILDDAFGDDVETAGHSTQAAASMPLGIFAGVNPDDESRETLLELVDEAVTHKILDSLGVVDQPEQEEGE
ncbi:MAG: DHH family phosphoesterase [Halobacteria archaeon]|nr:DHH family phosphoesterase [Halobacteria archaeon]